MPTDGFSLILRKELDARKAQGHTRISIDELEGWLSRLTPPEARAKQFEWKKQMASLAHQGRLETYKSVLEAGQTALKILITINGGAAAALLAFLSNLHGRQQPPVGLMGTSTAMVFFVGGVALTPCSVDSIRLA
jgi:hypothetical protein